LVENSWFFMQKRFVFEPNEIFAPPEYWLNDKPFFKYFDLDKSILSKFAQQNPNII